MNERRASRRGPTAGFYLLEVAAATAILAVALALALQFVATMARADRDAWRRQQALLLAHQRLERATARPYVALSSDSLVDLGLTSDEARRLGDGRIGFVVADETNPAAKRIEVTVDYRDARGNPGAPVKLSAWSFPSPGGAP